jgi:hypothetical protein
MPESTALQRAVGRVCGRRGKVVNTPFGGITKARIPPHARANAFTPSRRRRSAGSGTSAKVSSAPRLSLSTVPLILGLPEQISGQIPRKVKSLQTSPDERGPGNGRRHASCHGMAQRGQELFAILRRRNETPAARHVANGWPTTTSMQRCSRRIIVSTTTPAGSTARFGRKYGMVVTQDAMPPPFRPGLTADSPGGAALAATSPTLTGDATTSIGRCGS